MIDLDELERVEKVATAGPWYFAHNTEFGGDICAGTDGAREYLAHLQSDFRDGRPDAALIVAARNALPELIPRLRKADARVAEQRKKLSALADENLSLDSERDRLRDRIAELEAERKGKALVSLEHLAFAAYSVLCGNCGLTFCGHCQHKFHGLAADCGHKRDRGEAIPRCPKHEPECWYANAIKGESDGR